MNDLLEMILIIIIFACLSFLALAVAVNTPLGY